MHATVRVRKFVVNKISNGPGDDFLRAPIQIMTPSTALIQNANARDGKDPSSPEVKRGALQRERSSSVQAVLTGQVTRVQNPPRGRGRWTGRSREEKWRTRKIGVKLAQREKRERNRREK